MNTEKLPLVVRLRERGGAERLHNGALLELSGGFDVVTGNSRKGEREKGAMVRVLFNDRSQMAESVHALAQLMEKSLRQCVAFDNAPRPVLFEVEQGWQVVMRPSELPDMLRRLADGLAKQRGIFRDAVRGVTPIILPQHPRIQ